MKNANDAAIQDIVNDEAFKNSIEQTEKDFWKIAALLQSSTEFKSLDSKTRSDLVTSLGNASAFKKKVFQAVPPDVYDNVPLLS
jgi:hypothetical protein